MAQPSGRVQRDDRRPVAYPTCPYVLRMLRSALSRCLDPSAVYGDPLMEARGSTTRPCESRRRSESTLPRGMGRVQDWPATYAATVLEGRDAGRSCQPHVSSAP